jgi:hypothetical protein
VKISKNFVDQFSSSATLPEVRDEVEYKILERISSRHTNLLDPYWSHKYRREIDLTTHKPTFTSANTGDLVPILEGRMVSQYTCNFKRYVSGTGRAAKWAKTESKSKELNPQFWLPRDIATRRLGAVFGLTRAVFCDISGQTNERTMQAAVISGDVICGNKTPTMEFQDPLKMWAWVGIANSFVFDWLLRRQVTNTINYFILQNVPLPILDSNALGRIAQHAERAASLLAGDSKKEYAHIRSTIDYEVAIAYGINSLEMKTILKDFPLLDRGQPRLEGEQESTITKDLVLSKWEIPSKVSHDNVIKRISSATELGAVAYCHN